jgi:hypothetical protein
MAWRTAEFNESSGGTGRAGLKDMILFFLPLSVDSMGETYLDRIHDGFNHRSNLGG